MKLFSKMLTFEFSYTCTMLTDASKKKKKCLLWSVGFFIALCLIVIGVIVARGKNALAPRIEKGSVRSYFKKPSHDISIVGDNFMLDGQPLHIVSGSLHYFRLPAAYWRDRLRKLKAAGLNAVSTYVEWSYHEPEERQYRFKGDRDVAAFVRAAAEEGLHVLLRPGPYICAERDLAWQYQQYATMQSAAMAENGLWMFRGGFPYWLLGKYPNIRLRTTDSDFINETEIWLKTLFKQLTPLLTGNGGPIILVQIENEYGSYGTSMQYRKQSGDILRKFVGTKALLYTTDGPTPDYYLPGYVPGTLTTIDFGVDKSVYDTFKSLREFMPRGPLMNSEFYCGWLRNWGEFPVHVRTDDVVRVLREMLDLGIHINFYVFFGGSNFEYYAGSNSITKFKPYVTSYDYDAPLNEAGDPTPKYYAIRNVLKQYNFEANVFSEPTPSNKGAYGAVIVTPRIGLLTSKGRTLLGKKYQDVTGSALPYIEKLRQRSGLVLYETKLTEEEGVLEIKKPCDWIYVYVDGEFKGVINRMEEKPKIWIESNKTNSELSLLVENQGRINVGPLLHDRKGILSPVIYGSKVLDGTWSVSGYPLEVLTKYNTGLSNPLNLNKGPILFEGEFVLPKGQKALDTFLDTTGWGRGYVWVNGHNLGRYWPDLGPQVTLYVPGVWLKVAPARNRLQILELEKAPEGCTMEFIDYPILNRIANSRVVTTQNRD